MYMHFTAPHTHTHTLTHTHTYTHSHTHTHSHSCGFPSLCTHSQYCMYMYMYTVHSWGITWKCKSNLLHVLVHVHERLVHMYIYIYIYTCIYSRCINLSKNTPDFEQSTYMCMCIQNAQVVRDVHVHVEGRKKHMFIYTCTYAHTGKLHIEN